MQPATRFHIEEMVAATSGLGEARALGVIVERDNDVSGAEDGKGGRCNHEDGDLLRPNDRPRRSVDGQDGAVERADEEDVVFARSDAGESTRQHFGDEDFAADDDVKEKVSCGGVERDDVLGEAALGRNGGHDVQKREDVGLGEGCGGDEGATCWGERGMSGMTLVEELPSPLACEGEGENARAGDGAGEGRVDEGFVRDGGEDCAHCFFVADGERPEQLSVGGDGREDAVVAADEDLRARAESRRNVAGADFYKGEGRAIAEPCENDVTI